jgi:hypothetical protein
MRPSCRTLKMLRDRKNDTQFYKMPVMFRRARGSGHRRIVLAAAAVWLGCGVLQPVAQTPARFADRIAALSEPGGYFDTDNLVSNEASYVRVVPELVQRKVRGGAYIGVGPDQNFTYIAATRPSIAFILDIRRDNMLLHLLFSGPCRRTAWSGGRPRSSRSWRTSTARVLRKPTPRARGRS